MKLNQKLVKQLRNGEISAENDGTLEQLQEVFEAAFPEEYSPMGGYRFYFMDVVCTNEWDCSEATTLPIISISDFYEAEPFTGWAKDDNSPKWMVYFKNDVVKFGFDTFGEWHDEIESPYYKYSKDRDNRPATNEEIETKLSKEQCEYAQKRVEEKRKEKENEAPTLFNEPNINTY